MSKIMLDRHSPNTMMILGAALSGGDPLKMAELLVAGGATNCGDCGESHGDRCPWRETCAECGRLGGEGTGIDMASDRLCCDCAEEIERARARAEREEDAAARGDYLRDQQKDDELIGRHRDEED